jgi:hypothetical protein
MEINWKWQNKQKAEALLDALFTLTAKRNSVSYIEAKRNALASAK